MCSDDMSQKKEHQSVSDSYTDELHMVDTSNIELKDTPVKSNQFQEDAKQAREASRRLKRRMLTVIIVMVAFMVIAIPLIQVIDGQLNDNDESRPVVPDKPDSVIFYTPDYNADILKDKDYLDLDRSFRLKQGLSTTTIDPQKLNSYSPAVKVLYQLVNAVIAGDAETYNSLFSKRYFNDESNPPAEDPFTMQRVYDIVITKIRERSVSDEESGKYIEYIYEVEYKINRNDGTYRTDIGHDASRSQYFQLTDRDGQVQIDRLMYMME